MQADSRRPENLSQAHPRPEGCGGAILVAAAVWVWIAAPAVLTPYSAPMPLSSADACPPAGFPVPGRVAGESIAPRFGDQAGQCLTVYTLSEAANDPTLALRTTPPSSGWTADATGDWRGWPGASFAPRGDRTVFALRSLADANLRALAWSSDDHLHLYVLFVNANERS